jgi:hypothetical protein
VRVEAEVVNGSTQLLLGCSLNDLTSAGEPPIIGLCGLH